MEFAHDRCSMPTGTKYNGLGLDLLIIADLMDTVIISISLIDSNNFHSDDLNG